MLLLSGCVSTSIVDPNYNFDRSKGKALVLLSITETGDNRQFPSLVHRKIGGDNSRLFKSFKHAYDAPISRAAASKESDFGEILGSLLLVEVDPGDYEIYKWTIDVGNGFWYRDGLNYRFRAEAGQAIYIGNYHMNYAEGRVLRQQDRQERDVSRFKQLFPKLQGLAVSRSIVAGSSTLDGRRERGEIRIEDLRDILLPDISTGAKP